MFNWLTVFVMLPIEMSFGYLEHATGYLVSSLKASRQSGKEPEMLNVIIKPLTNAIIQIDKHVLDKIATNLSIDEPLIKRYCGVYKLDLALQNGTTLNSTHLKPCKSHRFRGQQVKLSFNSNLPDRRVLVCQFRLA